MSLTRTTRPSPGAEEIGRLLLRGDAQPPGFLGQPRLCYRHAVLRDDLCRVEVGAEFEGDGDPGLAIVGRDAAHVQHIFDAVDLLLDRSGDGVGDDLRRRAGVRRANDHRRRHDFGKLRDGQLRVRQHPHEHYDDRKHPGEDRPVDKEVCDLHRLLSNSDLVDGASVPASEAGVSRSTG